jgi:hypothetical protein
MHTTNPTATAPRPARRFLTTVLAVVATALVVTPSGAAQAAPGDNVATVTVASTGSTSIKVRPVLGSEGHFGLWDLKLKTSSGTTVKTLDRKNTLKALKKGSIAEVTFEKALKTSVVMIPIYTKVGNTNIINYVPITRTSIEGRILSITEIPGSCYSKTIKLGGRGEKVGVGVCRTAGRYEVIVRTTDADHKEDVIEALKKGTMIVTDAKSGQQYKSGFTIYEEYAQATIDGAPGAATKVKAGILADGPKDGKSEKTFTVTAGSTL